MLGRVLGFLTLPEAVGEELELGSADEALVGAHPCDLQHYLGQLQQGIDWCSPSLLGTHFLQPGETHV